MLGEELGPSLGLLEGILEGDELGLLEGLPLGEALGALEGDELGLPVGEAHALLVDLEDRRYAPREAAPAHVPVGAALRRRPSGR